MFRKREKLVSQSVEDAFKTLGIWEKAVSLHEQGLTWSQIANELICRREN